MITRARHLNIVADLLSWNPVVAVLGPRQVGKTTLARQLVERGVVEHLAGASTPPEVTFFDLENPDDLAVLAEPMLALSKLKGLVVIDEIQRRPDLFPVLRVLADRAESPARFLILGSASPDLLRQSSESLAGRIAYHELGSFALDEVGVEGLDRLWLRGGFPRSFLAATDDQSARWRQEFVRTYLERDLPSLGIQTPASTLERFWSMLAHYHGELWNAAELARNFGVSATTVRRYLDILTSTFVVRQLQPWHQNLAKRQVKSPKIFFSDCGLLHSLLRVDDPEALVRHPKVGASWEGLAIGTLIARLGADDARCFFWRTHQGAELDLLVLDGGRRRGFEVKRTSAPRITPSIRVALEDLQLDSLDVIHAGERTFPLAEKVRALPLARVWDELDA